MCLLYDVLYFFFGGGGAYMQKKCVHFKYLYLTYGGCVYLQGAKSTENDRWIIMIDK